MTTRATLLQLRDRLKAATGPSRELDTDLACALAGFERHPTIWCSVRKVGEVGWSETLWDVLALTASIDSAMTLARPEWRSWILSRGRLSPDEPAYGVAFYFDEAGDHEAAKAEHNGSLALCVCLARVEFELARSPR